MFVVLQVRVFSALSFFLYFCPSLSLSLSLSLAGSPRRAENDVFSKGGSLPTPASPPSRVPLGALSTREAPGGPVAVGSKEFEGVSV